MTESAAAPFMVEGLMNAGEVTLLFAPEARAFLEGLVQALSEQSEANMQVYWGFYDQEQQGYLAWKIWAVDRAAEFIFPEPAWPYLAEVVQQGRDVALTGAEYGRVQELATAGNLSMDDLELAVRPTLRLQGPHLHGVDAFLETVQASRLQHPVVTKRILRLPWAAE